MKELKFEAEVSLLQVLGQKTQLQEYQHIRLSHPSQYNN
jgi:hypothetical protein